MQGTGISQSYSQSRQGLGFEFEFSLQPSQWYGALQVFIHYKYKYLDSLSPSYSNMDDHNNYLTRDKTVLSHSRQLQHVQVA